MVIKMSPSGPFSLASRSELVRQILQDDGWLYVLHFIRVEPVTNALADAVVLAAGQEIQLPSVQ